MDNRSGKLTKHMKEQHRYKMVTMNMKSELNVNGIIVEIAAIHGILGVQPENLVEVTFF